MEVELEWIACIYDEGSCILLPCATKDEDFLGINFLSLAMAPAWVD